MVHSSRKKLRFQSAFRKFRPKNPVTSPTVLPVPSQFFFQPVASSLLFVPLLGREGLADPGPHPRLPLGLLGVVHGLRVRRVPSGDSRWRHGHRHPPCHGRGRLLVGVICGCGDGRSAHRGLVVTLWLVTFVGSRFRRRRQRRRCRRNRSGACRRWHRRRWCQRNR